VFFIFNLCLESSVLSKCQLGSGFQPAVGTAVQTGHCEFAFSSLVIT